VDELSSRWNDEEKLALVKKIWVLVKTDPEVPWTQVFSKVSADLNGSASARTSVAIKQQWQKLSTASEEWKPDERGTVSRLTNKFMRGNRENGITATTMLWDNHVRNLHLLFLFMGHDLPIWSDHRF
jgi:hypothetical protein